MSLHYAHKQDGNFTSERNKLYSGVFIVHDRTVHKVLKFTKYIKKYDDSVLRSSGICYYLDAKHFIHKLNPTNQANAPKSLVWRKKNKGCTTKGNKAGHDGKVTSFFMLYHLVKGFSIVNITRNLVVNYLLNL